MNFISNAPPRAALGLALALALSACASGPRAPLTINLVALNDFHGQLEAGRFTPSNAPAGPTQAGGIDTIAAALQAWRAEDGELLFVGAGDLIGASPAMSSMWADEPSIVALDMLGLNASAVGNHEFDQGSHELLRQQNGGCDSRRADKACKFAPEFKGAKFNYLAANVIDRATGKPFLPAYRVERVRGVKVALIGAVLKDTASVALASGIAGLDFVDEAEAVNRLIPELRAQGVRVFVLLIHQGGRTTEPFDQPACGKLQGPILDVVGKLDPAVKLIVSGHSHTGYLCQVDGRTVTQAEMGGHVLSRIALSVDPASGEVRSVNARNVVMTPGAWPADPKVDAYLAQVRARSAATLTRPVARLAVPLLAREPGPDGASALGGLVADAKLDATRALGARIAFMNNGGIRRDLERGADGVVRLGQAQMVLPFGNTLVVMSLSGAQLFDLLEQQFKNPRAAHGYGMLQVSAGFRYRWDERRLAGQRVLPGSVTLDGAPVDAAASYKVVVNNFLAEGGDGFPQLGQGGAKLDTGIRDLDALTDYLVKRDRAGQPAGAPAPGRGAERVAAE